MEEKQPHRGYRLTRDDLILAVVIIWAVCLLIFRY